MEENTNSENSLLQNLFFAVYSKAIVEAKSDEERREFAMKFARSPRCNFAECTNLIRFVAGQPEEEKEIVNLVEYAKLTMNTFLNERTHKAKLGFSLLTYQGDEIINSIGHALNEGVTEYLTIKTMELAKEDLKFNEETWAKATEDGTYQLEIELAKLLMIEFDETFVLHTYFGDYEKFEEFNQKFDQKFGPRSFIKLLIDSDSGNWKEVFSLFKK